MHNPLRKILWLNPMIGVASFFLGTAAVQAQMPMPPLPGATIMPPNVVIAESPRGDAPQTPKRPVASIMFVPKDFDAIRLANRDHINNVPDEAAPQENYLDQLTQGTSGEKRYYTYPQFYLEALVFDSLSEWSVRINNQLYTPQSDTVNTPLRVLEIDKNSVRLEWKPSAIDKSKGIGSNSNDDSIQLDKRFGAIIFRLHPNQTFSTYAMRVLEGKVLSVTVQDTIGAPQAGQPAPASGGL